MSEDKEVLLVKSLPDKDRVYTFYVDGTYDRVHIDGSKNLMERSAIGSSWTVIDGRLYYRHTDDKTFIPWAGTNNPCWAEELTGLLALRNILEK
jgi:hypothetical protein